jgi:hypothetical protein
MKRTLLLMAVCSCLVLPAMLTGCNRITASSVRSNMSPELQSVSLSREQRKNHHARVYDHTLRQVHDDWDYLLLLDRPRRMSKYPIP